MAELIKRSPRSAVDETVSIVSGPDIHQSIMTAPTEEERLALRSYLQTKARIYTEEDADHESRQSRVSALIAIFLKYLILHKKTKQDNKMKSGGRFPYSSSTASTIVVCSFVVFFAISVLILFYLPL
jgi:hypothetical protein